ncbi:hypothetical protein GQ55_3G122400 [Panicum hallii var. hallii]|uniref:Uncharacterized protein n=1 Tax=Panicum hallii var. hallii TaxID=1504633 RepID=A0A2T7E8N6_9POAL|nr:hypothetical protein GQ55_3G122400 [Panicum hallii var. hallii]
MAHTARPAACNKPLVRASSRTLFNNSKFTNVLVVAMSIQSSQKINKLQGGTCRPCGFCTWFHMGSMTPLTFHSTPLRYET